jgi:DNA-directed RNA polymerase subunit RPC12/RpoP
MPRRNTNVNNVASKYRCASCGKIDCNNRQHKGKARVNCDHSKHVIRTGSDTNNIYSTCVDCGAIIVQDRY